MNKLKVKKVMDFLIARNRSIRSNNPKISGWVDAYLRACLSSGKVVNILTPWSLSKAFEKRFIDQGNCFTPTQKERALFELEIPKIAKIFKENGFKLNWIIFLSRAYLKNRLLKSEVECVYRKMVTNLVENCCVEELTLVDWEDDVLEGRSSPNEEVMKDFEKYIKKGAFEYDFKRWKQWILNEGKSFSDDQLREETKYQIACEVNEGKLLLSENSPFGFNEFVFMPLGVPERYVFFSIITKDFRSRMVAVLPTYPWRI